MSNNLFNTIVGILGLLFDRELANVTKREQAMVVKNQQLGGSTDGFKHMGTIYSSLSGPARARGSYGRLHISLVDELDEILADRKTLMDDKDWIRQALTLVLRDCRDWQDMRDAIPNGLADLIPECRGLERMREEAFTLADNPRAYTQYMQLREKIEFYVATRLLY